MGNEFQTRVSQILNFFRPRSKEKNIIIFSVTIIGIAVLSTSEIMDRQIVISAALGLFLAWSVKALGEWLLCLFEDKRKVNSNNRIIKKIYSDVYMHCLEIDGRKQSFYYDISYKHDLSKGVEIKDDPSKKYSLPSMIENNFITLLQAHGNSYIENSTTIRLDKFEVTDEKLILYSSRSDYYSHLATNRAMDYLIDRRVSIRTLYEYGPLLNPLEESLLSNHIGINALIFLKDGSLILKHRRKDATISKNCLTSSVASRLILEDYSKKAEYAKEAMEDPIKKEMYKKLHFPGDTRIQVDFLGFGRDVYEGGKPQFYFDVQVDLTPEEYLAIYCKAETTQRRIAIDEDKEMYVCTGVNFAGNESDRLKITCYNNIFTHVRENKTLSPEKSLYVNIHLSNLFRKYFVNREENGSKAP